MPNNFAYGALLFWPVISLGLFLSLPVQRAVIWSLLLSFLFLPPFTSIDIAFLPAVDKTTIPAISTLLFAMIMGRRGDFRWPKSTMLNVLLAVAILSPILTGFFNREPLVVATNVRPPFDFYTSFSTVLSHFLRLIPFILGVGFLRTERNHRDLLLAMILGALFYSLLVLLEIRLSPQLMRWFYGIQNAFFLQQIRDGGYRAMAFLGHGLLVSDYLAISSIAAITMVRRRAKLFGFPAAVVAAYLIGILILNKSLGAFALTLLIVPAVYWLRPRRLLALGVVISCIVLSFPVTRSLGLVPVDLIATVTDKISGERAQSFSFRTMNEEALLARAEEKPIFGWGSFGRSRVIVETPWGTTQDVSVTDGLWIITFGQYGWVGFLALFGLLSYPLWRGYGLSKRQSLPPVSMALVGILIYYLLNFLPNAQETALSWLCAGALTGLVAPQRQTAQGRRRAMARADTPAHLSGGAAAA